MSVLIVNSMSCDMLWQFDAGFFFSSFFPPVEKLKAELPTVNTTYLQDVAQNSVFDSNSFSDDNCLFPQRLPEFEFFQIQNKNIYFSGSLNLGVGQGI